MIAVLYSWRIKLEKEKQFIAAWSEITEFFLNNHLSLGSRLHRDSNGIFYGYAQWKSLEQREIAFQNSSEIHDAVERMRNSIEESFPEKVLKLLADFLVSPDIID
jgi:hypothetical protein